MLVAVGGAKESLDSRPGTYVCSGAKGIDMEMVMVMVMEMVMVMVMVMECDLVGSYSKT